jgi:hypothetical protein
MKETKGLLISTHSRKSYPLKIGNNPIKKNNEYIIIGNGEIKISKNVTNDMTMLTNIDINCAFDIG